MSAVLILRSNRASFLRDNSCSQMRSTRQPRCRNVRVTSRSRVLFRASLEAQYAIQVRGIWPCRGQPCQKHPSTNTATRSRRQTKSGEPSSGTPRRQPVRPYARSKRTNRPSVLVLPVLRTSAMIAERRCGVKTSAMIKPSCDSGRVESAIAIALLASTEDGRYAFPPRCRPK